MCVFVCVYVCMCIFVFNELIKPICCFLAQVHIEHPSSPISNAHSRLHMSRDVFSQLFVSLVYVWLVIYWLYYITINKYVR